MQRSDDPYSENAATVNIGAISSHGGRGKSDILRHTMTLGRKMAYQICAMIAGLFLLGGAALWGLNSLRQDYGSALVGYGQLRQLFEVGAHLQTAKVLLALDPPERTLGGQEVRLAMRRALLISGEIPLTEARRGEIERPIAEAQQRLASGEADAARQAVGQALASISRIAAEIRAEAEERQQAAQSKRRTTTAILAGISTALVAAAIALGIWQYRGVMGPLGRLTERVRQIAARQFSHMADRPSPDNNEFSRLTQEFDRMAGELDRHYHELEAQVAHKSQELVRSERLASVGFLAAGVAHEINNPLSIIAGYAEYTLDQLQSQPPDSEQLCAVLRIVCDEAFRCKDITQRLLSLARPGDGQLQVVDLAAIARQIVDMVGGLPPYKNCRLRVEADAAAQYATTAIEAQMKQMVMNLIFNALEATAPAGEVVIRLQRQSPWIVLSVHDDGRGMDHATLEQVFEPFYTDKRGAQQPGTGLGLSITHAIISEHGGSIHAHSDGPGKGSAFTVRLPIRLDGMTKEQA